MALFNRQFKDLIGLVVSQNLCRPQCLTERSSLLESVGHWMPQAKQLQSLPMDYIGPSASTGKQMLKNIFSKLL